MRSLANIVRRKKKPGSLQIFFYLCDNRTGLRKNRFEPEGSEKYKEVNNSIKRCMKKAHTKKNWIGEQCSEIEKNLKKNNSKRAYQLVKDFIIIIINSLTTRVVGAPQMILQPVFSIFTVLHCPLGLAELQACPFRDVVFPPLPLSALSSSSVPKGIPCVKRGS